MPSMVIRKIAAKFKPLGFIIILFISHSAGAQIKPVYGFDSSGLTSGSSNYGWELLALYPFAGLQINIFRLSAFAGGGLSTPLTSKTDEYGEKTYYLLDEFYWTYNIGGNLDVFINKVVINFGGGMAGPNLADESKLFYPFASAAIGWVLIDDFFALKLYYDYNFDNNGYKIGLLSSFNMSFNGLSDTPPAPRPTAPKKNPTITSEELKQVELAYAETVRGIDRRGKHLYINNLSERYTFIQKYQGRPDKDAVRAAANTKLEWYDIRITSQEDIVAIAKREPNDFVKVRMIHDWVADVFAYDYDLLWWMDNVSGRNAEFTLAAIIERQRGVCFEYAILFWFLLDAAGVDTYLISDHSNPGIGHAYNMVVINGTGYIVDTTWDSGNRYENGRITEFKRMNSKDYFMPDISRSYKLRRW